MYKNVMGKSKTKNRTAKANEQTTEYYKKKGVPEKP
jgi:hypothetical protein